MQIKGSGSTVARESMSNKKTVSQAFRLDVNTHEALVEEARRQRVSLNVLVGHILED